MRCFRHRGAFPQLEGQGFRQLLCALMLDVETPSGIKQAAAFFQDPLLLKGLDLDSACVLHCLPRRRPWDFEPLRPWYHRLPSKHPL
eukprot:g25062.t1